MRRVAPVAQLWRQRVPPGMMSRGIRASSLARLLGLRAARCTDAAPFHHRIFTSPIVLQNRAIAGAHTVSTRSLWSLSVGHREHAHESRQGSIGADGDAFHGDKRTAVADVLAALRQAIHPGATSLPGTGAIGTDKCDSAHHGQNLTGLLQIRGRVFQLDGRR